MKRDHFAFGQAGCQLAVGHRESVSGDRHQLSIDDDLRGAIGDHAIDGAQARAIGGNQHFALFSHRGRRGNYSETELEEWAHRIVGWAKAGTAVFAYFNNDWEGFAPRNAARLQQLVQAM